ncbi:MAG: PfkB family carbohydrate kinase [Nitrospinota bacterium]|jgi:sugar/nucleoside kinase (ribokinase family)|nr:PfkB family carbohydrate kinase [Nitrospinota bacterium]HJM43740.1 PfkB family carbohydrate kinase [Nitrospinota bacterium]
MDLLVVGSVALDSVKTPFGEKERILGGSAMHFSVSASLFTPVRLVGVVGKDFPEEHLEFLRGRRIDLEGLEVADGETFRWVGEYTQNLNEAITLETHLNVFADFQPKLPERYRSSEFVFLANIDPELQLDVLQQVEKPRYVACDTMNFWIEGKPEALWKTLEHVDTLVINDGEARLLAGEENLVKAARSILGQGPKSLIVKRGEYGALLFDKEGEFWAPALPLDDLSDPTGAGDSFAGGFMGYLASRGEVNHANFRRAVIYGSTMASFNVQAFSLDRLRTLTPKEIEDRARRFKALSDFDLPPRGS